MEAVTVRRIAKSRPPELTGRLEALIKQMDVAEKKGEAEKWSALNMEFHLAHHERGDGHAMSGCTKSPRA